MKTATAIKQINSQQILFELSEPIFAEEYTGEDYDSINIACYYVISSKQRQTARGALYLKETFLFRADKEGNILSFSELSGSLNNIYDCYKPLVRLGYTIVKSKAFEVLYDEN